MTSTQIEVKDYHYFADNQWRRSEDNQSFEVHEPYSDVERLGGRPPKPLRDVLAGALKSPSA